MRYAGLFLFKVVELFRGVNQHKFLVFWHWADSTSYIT